MLTLKKNILVKVFSKNTPAISVHYTIEVLFSCIICNSQIGILKNEFQNLFVHIELESRTLLPKNVFRNINIANCEWNTKSYHIRFINKYRSYHRCLCLDSWGRIYPSSAMNKCYFYHRESDDVSIKFYSCPVTQIKIISCIWTKSEIFAVMPFFLVRYIFNLYFEL